MVQEIFPTKKSPAPEPPGIMEAVRNFAASCGYEQKNCRHVADLACQLFDYWAKKRERKKESWAHPNRRILLEASALLKDVGYIINYTKHHLYSYHLIIHSNLPGFSPKEIQLIANIARYHRRGWPKTGHVNFALLNKTDRQLVRRLAALLRIADGLDRNRLGNVKKVKIRINQTKATFWLYAKENPAVEMWGAQQKSKLFRRVFGLTPVFRWVRKNRFKINNNRKKVSAKKGIH
jgi:exopolyphosphatase/guanosine-5'-triphosphate,3'-diphosphate pyrophosphatase